MDIWKWRDALKQEDLWNSKGVWKWEDVEHAAPFSHAIIGCSREA
jgi:hypothetical protein